MPRNAPRHTDRHASSNPRRRSPRRTVAALCAVITAAGGSAIAAGVATASPPTPTVTSLSRASGPYWGATRITVRGTGFTDATQVLFGRVGGYALQVLSPTALTVLTPWHGYRTVDVRVVSAEGTSPRTSADAFTFAPPTMTTPIMGGLTARQEQLISARVRAAHHGVRTAPAGHRWTAAMGVTALRRARSWLGLPYSWDGGAGSGPTTGACAHNGGDLDCHVVGFDCSGLALYAWSPYEQLVHYAATQHTRAGRFHPAMGELMPGDLVFFSGYIAGGIGHVAVYAGHGMVVQAAQSGTQVMRSRLVDVIAESGSYRGATRPMSTGVQGVAPTISSLTAQLPAGGGNLVITGRNLAAVTAVSVGGAWRYRFVSRTASRLVVAAPAHASGQVAVTVSTAWGTARGTTAYLGAPPTPSSTPPSSSPPSSSAPPSSSTSPVGTGSDTASPSTASSSTASSGVTAMSRTARSDESVRPDRQVLLDRIGDRWYLLARTVAEDAARH